MKPVKIIFLVFFVVVLLAIGFFVCEHYQYAKAVQNNTRKILQENKNYLLRLSFDGIIAEKTYNINYKRNQYSITISLHQIEPKPIRKMGYYTYYNFFHDSLLTICIPQNVYNQIEKGEMIKKKANDYCIEVSGKKMLILSSTKNKWLPYN
ncbi:MAG TPA: hypothetical protein PLF32_09460 [Bacteroidales bacterium]|nr:hypothetical protein [Bacteroidales bacterium]HOR82866.1 hypothetical protein [Bacteroidales bacterium]HPJ91806.1 hypothetical protein [Bacteroidales bacterium]